MQLTMSTSFTLFLLEDHYGVSDDDAAKMLGNLGFCGDLASVSTELVLGYIMDYFGRKIPCVVGLILAGGAFIGSPLPSRVSWLYFFRMTMNVGALPILYSPYQIDYVHKGSMGKLQALMSIVSQFASIAATVGAI